MANYKAHCTFNSFLGLPLTAVGMYYGFSPRWECLLIFSFCFLYATFFMSPDLDLSTQIKPASLRGVLTYPFRSYARVFKHRGLSHSILFGTSTRIIWLFGFVFILSFILRLPFVSFSNLKLFFFDHQAYLLYAFAGILAADLCHLLLDKRL